MDALLVRIDRPLRWPAAARRPWCARSERGQGAAALWAEVEASGYAELLVDEAAGGAGLGLREAFALWLACGRHALPVPLAQTPGCVPCCRWRAWTHPAGR